MKRSIVNCTIVLVSVCIALIVCEGLLRVTPYKKLLPYSGIPTHYYAANRETGYDLAKSFATSTHRFADGSYQIWTNELGCFDTPYNGEKSYIFLTGDSFTWGFTPFSDKWGTRLESLIGMRVVKCGVPGYGTRQELEKTSKTLKYLPPPSLIMLGYFSNDPHDDAAFPNSLVYEGTLIKNLSNEPGLSYDELEQRLPQYAEWAQKYCMWNMPQHPTLQRVKCYLRNNSILYLLTQSAVKSVVPISTLQRIGIVNEQPAVPTNNGSDATDAHLLNLAKFKILAQQVHAPFLVVFIPPREDVYSTATSTTYAVEKKFMDEQGIDYFDPLEGMRKAASATTSSLYWPKDLHLNSEGNRVLGELVAEHLRTSSTMGR